MISSHQLLQYLDKYDMIQGNSNNLTLFNRYIHLLLILTELDCARFYLSS